MVRRSKRQVVAAGIGRTGVQIFSRCRHAAVAQCGLDEVNWTTSVQGMGGVGVAKPVAGHILVDAQPVRRLS